MAFVLTYLMSTGRGVHKASTAALAVEIHALLKAAGAGEVVVTGPTGKLVSLLELQAAIPLASPPKVRS